MTSNEVQVVSLDTPLMFMRSWCPTENIGKRDKEKKKHSKVMQIQMPHLTGIIPLSCEVINRFVSVQYVKLDIFACQWGLGETCGSSMCLFNLSQIAMVMTDISSIHGFLNRIVATAFIRLLLVFSSWILTRGNRSYLKIMKFYWSHEQPASALIALACCVTAD